MSSIPTTTTDVSQDGGSGEAHRLSSTAVGVISGGVAAGVILLGAFFFLLRWWGTRKRGLDARNQPAAAPDQTSMIARQYRGLIGRQSTDPRGTRGYHEQTEIANRMDWSSMDPSGRERHPTAPYPEWI